MSTPPPSRTSRTGVSGARRPPQRRRRRRRSRLPRWVPLVVVAVIVVLAAPAIALWVFQRTTDGVLPNVSVEGQSVSGLSAEELRSTVEEFARARLDEPVVVTGQAGEVTANRAAVGTTVDVDTIADQAWSHGRSGFWGALGDHISARRGEQLDIPLTTTVDQAELEAWAADAAAQLSREPSRAGVRFDSGPEAPGGDDANRAIPVEPVVGVTVDAGELTTQLSDALSTPGAVRVEIEGQTIPPEATQADLDAALPVARRAVSAPITLVNPAGGGDIELSPAALADVFGMPVNAEAPEGERLYLAVIPDVLQERVGEQIAAADVAPTDATIALAAGGGVSITDGSTGFRVDAGAVADQVVQVASGEGERTAELVGEVVEPEFSRADAEALQITEPVSSFTTNHACCESRVANIHRFADIVDGALVKPGERFSLNEHVGPRTQEKGFVSAGVIIDGEFEEDIGGGVSQFATTFFNAAFFSGVDIIQHQPHSYYISRYPEGRESTINYGSIDVVIENNSPYGIIIDTSYTDTSITVTFVSHPWAQVEEFSSGRRNVVPGAVRPGFDITYGRTVTYPDGTTSRDEWSHHYRPEN